MYVHLPLYAPDRFLRESHNGVYGAAVACIDWVAGAILTELKRLNIDDKTLVVFTSDNGSRGDRGGSNAPLRGGKGTTWEGGLRVPCIARWPGRIPAGQVCSKIVTSMDLLPTFCEVSGAAVPDDRAIDGRSAFGIFENSGGEAPRDTFYYYYKDQLEAVRSGEWKLFVRRKDEEARELYNLRADVGEQHNHFAEHPEIVKNLESKLQVCRDDLGDSATGTQGTGCRPCGTVSNPKPLTEYSRDHPYYIAMYDLTDAG